MLPNTKNVCRPKQLTARWVRELSEAMTTLCPQTKFIHSERCECTEKRVTETCFKDYLHDLQSSSCYKQKKIEIDRVLSFEVDYNQYRLAPQ